MAVIQAFIYSKQLDVIRKDQRPWIRVIVSRGNDLSNTMRPRITTTNIGKTPAKSINARFFVESVNNGDQPQFNAPQRGHLTTGVMFPNDTVDSTGVIEYPVPVDQLEKLQSGQLFFVIYAIVDYSDVFDRPHWTKYCNFVTASTPEERTITAKKCTDYNDTDND